MNTTFNRNPRFMNRMLSLGLLVGGVVLVIFGLNSTDSLSSSISRFFTGSPTDETILMLVGGSAAVAIGLVGLRRVSVK